MPSYSELKTPISGATIILNKVVSDERGHFCNLAEADNPALGGLKHLHASIATTPRVARGEHYHYRLVENFYTLGGTALWILHDFNEESPTYGTTYALILGDGKKKIKTKLPVFYLDEGKIAQLTITPKIYHAFWPLTDDPVVVFVTGTTGYDKSDYARPSIEEVPGAKEILAGHGIGV